MRQPNEKVPKRFLTACIMNTRKVGEQKHILQEHSALAINRMLVYNEVDTKSSKDCPSNTCIPLAKEVGMPVEITSIQVPKGSTRNEENIAMTDYMRET
jgi:hypothetical protein